MALTTAQRELHDLMSDTSEEAYCAGWMDGTEYRLWKFMTDPADDGEWGRATLGAPLRDRLAALSQQIDGWIVFDSAAPYEPGHPIGAAFIRTNDWLPVYEAEATRRAKLPLMPGRYLRYAEIAERLGLTPRSPSSKRPKT